MGQCHGLGQSSRSWFKGRAWFKVMGSGHGLRSWLRSQFNVTVSGHGLMSSFKVTVQGHGIRSWDKAGRGVNFMDEYGHSVRS